MTKDLAFTFSLTYTINVRYFDLLNNVNFKYNDRIEKERRNVANHIQYNERNSENNASSFLHNTGIQYVPNIFPLCYNAKSP